MRTKLSNVETYPTLFNNTDVSRLSPAQMLKVRLWYNLATSRTKKIKVGLAK